MTKGMKITLKILIFVVLFFAVLLGVALIGNRFKKVKRQFFPDYPKIDLSLILEKDELTDEDYDILYSQTGLTKIGIDRLNNDAFGKGKIIEIQNDYFTDYKTTVERVSPFGNQHVYETWIKHVYLEDGDILVTDTTNFSFWRCGHSEIVVDGSKEYTLFSAGYGTKSEIMNCNDFFWRINFAVYRVKCDDETRKNVVEFAKTLEGHNYLASVGFTTPKNPKQLGLTNCGHIVWYCYQKFGIDIDGNGGAGVFPSDFTLSDQLELVQVYGFNPDKVKW